MRPEQRTLAELQAWHARQQEEAIDPARPIVDAHHHLWWRPPEAYQLPELLADTGSGHDIRASVFVQNGAMHRADGPSPMKPVGETEYVNGIAATSASGLFGRQRLCAGIVGFANLTLGEAVRPVLDAHKAAAGGRFKGVRHQAQWHAGIESTGRSAPPAGLLADTAFRTGFDQLAPLGLSFDAWIYFTQLHELDELAAAFPETAIILNHIGAPLGIGPYEGKRNEVFAIWADGMRALARRGNVAVKLGGLGMPSYGFGFETWEAPASSADLVEAWRPYLDLCISAFGADRCMFESNFPVDKHSCSYRTLWNAFKRYAAPLTATEQDDLFQCTARRIYKLEPPADA